MKVLDLLCDADGDLKIENGDFIIGNSDQRHNYDIMASNTGDWKEYPLVGFNALYYINSRVTSTVLNQNSKIQLQADGCTNIITDLTIDANNKLTGEVNGTRIQG